MTPAETAAFKVAAQEFDSIHNLLDIARVPRQIDDKPLSAAQRVAHLVAQWRTDGTINKAAGHATH
jgi:hypothetical protein